MANSILIAARGGWQKNKCHDILIRGYTENNFGYKNKRSDKKIRDYKQSLAALINRINIDLFYEESNYEIRFHEDYYYLTRM